MLDHCVRVRDGIERLRTISDFTPRTYTEIFSIAMLQKQNCCFRTFKGAGHSASKLLYSVKSMDVWCVRIFKISLGVINIYNFFYLCTLLPKEYFFLV